MQGLSGHELRCSKAGWLAQEPFGNHPVEKHKQGNTLSIELRRTEMVYNVIQQIAAAGKETLRPGDVSTRLREMGSPLGSWEIRAEFSVLERQSRIACDAESGAWFIVQPAVAQDSAG